MRSSNCVLAAIVLYLALICTGSSAKSEPSRRLQAILDAPRDAVAFKDWDLVRASSHMLRHSYGISGVCIGIESAGSDHTASLDLPASSLREQLDKLAAAYNDIWQASGDWVNFIPADKKSDPNYVFNMHIPSRIVVSNGASIFSPAKAWMEQHYITSFSTLGLQIVAPGQQPLRPYKTPDRIILINPTLRDYANAQNTISGYDYWAAAITTRPVLTPGAPPDTILAFSGGVSRRFGEMDSSKPADTVAKP